MGKQLIMNNVVHKDTLRGIQSKTLKELKDILIQSFGPNGSNTCIKRENALSRYSKDGHTIIGALHYNGIIEQSIKDDVESITRHIVKTVGDGTTSAVILASLIFDYITGLEDSYKPVEILNKLETVTDDIKAAIKDSAVPLDNDLVYDIAMISTNGNEFISQTLKEIYEEFGNGVFIDVSPSTGNEFIIKDYNGMTLNTGYCDSCYVTNSKNNTAEVDKPSVYFFEHPIDTRELGVYLDSIVSRNIIVPVNEGTYDKIVPTVIFAPRISQDMSSVMDSLTSTMASTPISNKLPICIITDYHEVEQLNDLAKMCNAKLIRKYIDTNVYKSDVERGIAPTPDNIFEWGGSCDRVVAYSDKTVFVNPSAMYNEDGSYSELYNNIVNFLETEISKSISQGDNIRDIGTLKRRLHSLKSNMVELFVGGITQADRDSLRDLVEDAVLNIRSAAENGVGYGANMSAAYNSSVIRNLDNGSFYNEISTIINKAYHELINILYENTNLISSMSLAPSYDDTAYDFAMKKFMSEGQVFNIRTNSWESNVRTSIMSDITILDTVTRIIGIMATCNQFVLPTAMHNIYEDK